MKKSKRWKIIKEESVHGRKVYSDNDGDVKVTYSKAPQWAQIAALEIYRDAEENGFPTEKGIKDIVRMFWARIISDATKS
jgi:hypothetical protein